MIDWLYERVTGQPWTSMRSCTAEYGQTPAAKFWVELSPYTDAELLAFGDKLVAQLRAEKRARVRVSR